MEETIKLTKAEKKVRNIILLDELINAHDSFIIQSHKDIDNNIVVAGMAISHVERLIKYRREENPSSKTLTDKIEKEFESLIENRNKIIDNMDSDELKKRVRVFLLKPQKGREYGNNDKLEHVESDRSSETTGIKEEVNK